jgi:UDP-glucose 4-epimerase
MKILVTGGAGFIASHVVDKYIALEHEVTVADDLSFGKKENVNEKARFYKVDIKDQNALKEIFLKEKPEVVNHHAAVASVMLSLEEPQKTIKTNVIGTINLLELAGRAGTKKFIFSSTGGALYGNPERLPATEETPIEPLSSYGLSKWAAEEYIRLACRIYQLPYLIFRYPNVYGPRQNPEGEAGVVAIFTGKMLAGIQPTIYGDGSKERDYVFIEDIVEANVIALEAKENDVFQLGWGKGIKDIEVFEAVRDALGLNIKPLFAAKRTGEVDKIYLDASKARKILGWEPKVAFKNGIARTVKAMKEK